MWRAVEEKQPSNFGRREGDGNGPPKFFKSAFLPKTGAPGSMEPKTMWPIRRQNACWIGVRAIVGFGMVVPRADGRKLERIQDGKTRSACRVVGERGQMSRAKKEAISAATQNQRATKEKKRFEFAYRKCKCRQLLGVGNTSGTILLGTDSTDSVVEGLLSSPWPVFMAPKWALSQVAGWVMKIKGFS